MQKLEMLRKAGGRDSDVCGCVVTVFQRSHCDAAVPCLFNVAEDPCEMDNVASSRPTELARLRQMLKAYNQTYVTALAPPADPTSNPKYWNYTWTNWKDYPRPAIID
ncbi:hypothetical protein PR048_027807 [Dryococelus australis]|uniref:Uncharacterized protein n=1 Tax=Dryococelus australis TaxID=614101 RepID=A0ABQ9GHH7_9NEOP|nr:hypothetical protein PR048_027807 [Dryococelus australis]